MTCTWIFATLCRTTWQERGQTRTELEELRYENVLPNLTTGSVDLVLNAETSSHPKRPANNGVKGEVGSINLRGGRSTTFLFKFVATFIIDNFMKKSFWEKELAEHRNLQKWLRELENTCKYKGKIATLQLRACPKVRHQLNLRNRDRKTTNLDNELATNFADENLANLIFKKKLVALLLERHFALAASFQLYANKAWKKLRVASNEISFGQLIGAKELHQQLRREQLDCKDLRSASFRALCPASFEDSSFTEEHLQRQHLPRRELQTTAASKPPALQTAP